MTGYSWQEVVGKNCRFLQGPETNPDHVQQLREAIHGSRSCSVNILNYRKDGSKFWNLLHVSPVRSFDGKIHFYCGVLMEVSTGVQSPIPTYASQQQLGVVGPTQGVAEVGASGGEGTGEEGRGGAMQGERGGYHISEGY
ncbi:unnamed protein product [Closterium sp. Naga37s-1]|nr:unnamed protein product [Closterium sp. Naga37s-1]